MKLNFNRWRGVLRGLLAGWILFAGALAVRAQEEQVLPDSAELQGKLEALEDKESQEAQWLVEAIANLKALDAAKAEQQGFIDGLAEAPAREAELTEQLTASLPEMDTQVDPSLPPDEILKRADELEQQAQSAKDDVDEATALLKKTQALLGDVDGEVEQFEAQLEAAQQARITAISSNAPEAELDAAVTRTAWLQAEIDNLESKRPWLESRGAILSIQVQVEDREYEYIKVVADAWEEEAQRLRELENAKRAQSLREQVADLIAKHPELESFREPFEELANLRSGERSVQSRIDAEEDALEAKLSELQALVKRFDSAKRRQGISGTTELLGLVLRDDYEVLPRPAALRAQVRAVEQEMIAVELDKLDLEEKLADLNEEAEAEAIFGPDVTEQERLALNRIENLELDTIGKLRGKLDELLKAFREHRGALEELVEVSATYRDFIERRILWVRSTDLDPWSMVRDMPAAALGVSEQLSADLSDGQWIRSGNRSMRTLLTGSAVAIALFALRRTLLRKREEFGGLVRSYRTDRFILTIRSAVQTLLLALPMPLLAWTLGSGLDHAPSELLRAAGEGLREAAWVWWVLRTAKGICAPSALGVAHFRWPGLGVRALERELLWFTPLAVGLTWVFATLARQSNSNWSDSLGRCAFIVAMFALALFGRRLLGEKSPLWSGEGVGLLGRGRAAWYGLATVLPVALALAALSGFYYTALEFELRLRWSLGLGFLLLLLNALLSRWLFHSRRKLAVRQAMEARAQREREAEAGSEEAQEASRMAFDAERVDIPGVDAKTRQLFRTSLTLASVIGLYLLWASALPALRGLDRVQIWPSLEIVELETEAAVAPAITQAAPEAGPESEGAEAPPIALPSAALLSATSSESSQEATGLGLGTRVTLANVLLAVLFGLLTAVFSKNLPALLELAILQRLPLESGARYAIATIARYLILIVGISATTSALGIGWQKVQWLAAALTFGLAFGLQEIFANFVSGLILLLERPIRVGDIVTVGTTEGRVTQLRMRATTIQDWDRRELLVPNKEFITGNVINWTLTDPVTRVVIPVGIAYGSDVGLARKLLLDLASKNDLVMDDPRPQALFLSFGASSLDFQLRVFISNRDVWPELMNSLHSSIDAAFRQANIEISFPQRDLHLRSVDAGIVERLGGKDGAPAAD